MKIKLYRICMPVIMACMFILVSCNKYLDVKPKGVQTLGSVSDYDQWLNSTELESAPQELNLLGDNEDMVNITTPPTTVSQLIYTWSPQFDQNVSSSPILWSFHYHNIYYYNTLLLGIDKATEGSEQKKASLKAEALLGRAYEYLYLVNEYGKVYNPATAATDLAVPLVSSNNITDPTPKRSTVQQVYDQIIGDLNKALPNLPTDNSSNRCRGSVAAALSILARTYLFMGNYPQAAKYAQMAIDNGNSPITDYNTIADVGFLKNVTVRNESFYSRGTILSVESPATSFMKLFTFGDLRQKFRFLALDPSYTFRGYTLYWDFGIGASTLSGSTNWGTSAAEMQLIISEVAARNGDLSTALEHLANVRKARINKNFYVAFASADATEILKAIFKERNLEMGYSGMRWFDMRRLDAQGLMPTVTRLDGKGAVIATLAPGSPRYTLQVPVQITYYNPDWPQNP